MLCLGGGFLFWEVTNKKKGKDLRRKSWQFSKRGLWLSSFIWESGLGVKRGGE